MEHDRGHSSRVWLDVVFILLVAAVFYGYKLGARSFENHDHQLYAYIADEMVEHGDWLAMRTGSSLYTNKPHLLFWAIRLASLPTGKVTPLSARLPGAMAAVGVCLVTFLFARALFDRRTGYLASFFLMGTHAFSWNARRVKFDIVLTFFALTALFLLFQAYRRRESSQRNVWYYAGAGIAIALAFLSKGPIALILTLVPFIVFLLIQRRFLKNASGILYAVIPLSIIILTWFVFYVQEIGAAALLRTLSHDTIAHVVDKSDQWIRLPFYYYITDIPTDFVPWSLFFPLAAVVLYDRFRRGRPENYLFLCIWIVSVTFLLSFAYSKSTRYSIPIYPALAMLTAGACADAITNEQRARKWVRRLADVPAVSAAVGMSVALIAAFLISLFGSQFRWLLLLSLIFMAITLPLAVGVRRLSSGKRFMRCLVVIVLFMLFFNLGHAAYLTENDDKYSPMKVVYGKFGEDIEAGRFFIYKSGTPDLDYYVKAPIKTISEEAALGDYLASNARVYCMIRETDFDALPEHMRANMEILHKTTAKRSSPFLIVTNRLAESQPLPL